LLSSPYFPDRISLSSKTGLKQISTYRENSRYYESTNVSIVTAP
jgi:hypothetical protein